MSEDFPPLHHEFRRTLANLNHQQECRPRPRPLNEQNTDELIKMVKQARAERDNWYRLFNRIEAAISNHQAGCLKNDIPELHDEALWAARDRILVDAARGVR